MKHKIFASALALTLTLGIAAATPAYAQGEMAVPGLNNKIALEGRISAVIDQDGGLWTWGTNYFGQVGNGGGGDYSDASGTPYQKAPVKILDDVVTVTSSVFDRSAAVTADGSLWVWGYDAKSLGLGDRTLSHNGQPIQTSPTKILDNVVDVSMGSPMSAALKRDGTLWMWGYNRDGVLGNDALWNYDEYGAHYQTVPAKVMDNVAAVSCGVWHTAVIKTDGSLWVWGSNRDGQLGIGEGGSKTAENGDPYQDTPVKVMDDVIAVSCGSTHTAAVKSDGSVWTWGENSGNLGTGDFVTRYVPTKIMDGGKAVACGPDTTFILCADNTLWGCGDSNDGSLGMGSSGNIYVDMGVFGGSYVQTVPAKIMDDVAEVATTSSSTFVIKTDGTLWGFGNNGLYQKLGMDENIRVVSAPTQTNFVTAQNPWQGNVPEPNPTVGGFSDVPETAYYADAVVWAVDKGVTSGTSATTFSPDATCTTAEILTFLWRANGAPAPAGSNAAVPAGKYYTDAANWALEKGLTDTFSAATPATRAATVTYLWKLAGKPAADAAAFTDVDADAEYAHAVAWAVKEGITAGTSATTFAPDKTCTRGQIVTFLYRDLAE